MENSQQKTSPLDLFSTFKSLFRKNIDETEDRRPEYVWLAVILANIVGFLVVVSISISEVYYSSGVGYYGDFVVIFVFILFFSVVPVLISSDRFKWQKILMFRIIPVLLVLVSSYALYHYFTCTGKFCNLLDMLVLMFVGGGAVIFYAVYYIVGKYFKKWNPIISRSFIYLELVLVVVASLTTCYVIYFNQSISHFKPGNKAEIKKMRSVCENSIGYRTYECWDLLIRSNRDEEICTLVNSKVSQGQCFETERSVYDQEFKSSMGACGSELKLSLDQNQQFPNDFKWTFDNPLDLVTTENCWEDVYKKYSHKLYLDNMGFKNVCSYAYNLIEEECVNYFTNDSKDRVSQ